MKLSQVILCGVSLAMLAHAHSAVLPGTGIPSSRSHSGQFLVKADPRLGQSRLAIEHGTNAALLRIDPTLLPISAERIKQALARQVGELGPWQAKIHLDVYLAESLESPVLVSSELFRDGWQYRVELPNVVQKDRFISSLVQAMLLEFANRHPGQRAAELPDWLVEGLTAELLATREMELVLNPPTDLRAGIPTSSSVKEGRRQSALEQARQLFRFRKPLTFEQISWPTDLHNELESSVYRHSCHLFVSRLLADRAGPARLRTMLTQLTQFQNWQFAFLQAFGFPRTLDAEKWWTLQVSHFSSRLPTETWDLETSRQKLEQALLTDVHVRTETNELPALTQVDLQTVVKDMEPSVAKEVLLRRSMEMQLLELRVAPELRPVTHGYALGLGWIARELGTDPNSNRQVVSRALQILDRLDTARQADKGIVEGDLPRSSLVPPSAGLSPNGSKRLQDSILRGGI